MRVFEITSTKFTGKVIVKFNEQDCFAGIDFSDSDITVGQVQWFLKHLPATSHAMGVFPEGMVTEVLESIDFTAFWNRYNDKARRSRVKTERVWNRMSRAEQVKAYNYVPQYFRSIPSGVMKKYATTYLNDQLWNN